MSALAVEVNGKLSHLKSVPADERESRAMMALQNALSVLEKCPSWRQAYVIQRDVEAMRGAARIYRLSIEVQIKAANIAIRCIYELGRALQESFGPTTGKTRKIASLTQIPFGTILAALHMSSFTWGQVSKASEAIVRSGRVPVISLVLYCCNHNVSDLDQHYKGKNEAASMRGASLSLMGEVSTVQRVVSTIQKLHERVAFTKTEVMEAIVRKNYAELSNSTARQDLAALMWSYRALGNSLRTLRSEMQSAKDRFRR